MYIRSLLLHSALLSGQQRAAQVATHLFTIPPSAYASIYRAARREREKTNSMALASDFPIVSLCDPRFLLTSLAEFPGDARLTDFLILK
jgi:hypothetical protein